MRTIRITVVDVLFLVSVLATYPFLLNSDRQDEATPQPPPLRSRPGAATPRRIRSAELFGDQATVLIEHGEAVYRLSRTSLDKLILTK